MTSPPAPGDDTLRLVRSASVAQSFARAHVFEWVSSGMMIGMAVEILLTRGLTYRGGSFREISSLGIPDDAFVAFFLIFGVLRCVALYLNGRLHAYGPVMRAASALAGSLVWGWLGGALLVSLVLTKTMNLGIAMYLFMVIGEWMSGYRAVYDVGRRSAH